MSFWSDGESQPDLGKQNILVWLQCFFVLHEGSALAALFWVVALTWPLALEKTCFGQIKSPGNRRFSARAKDSNGLFINLPYGAGLVENGLLCA